MSSMPISRKRNNNSRRTKILVSILGFLCLSVLISGCSRTPKNNAGQSDGTGSAVLTSSLSEEQLAHVKECNGRRVSSDQPVELVVMNGGKPEPFAVLQPGQLVQLKEINDPNLITSQYLPLDGMDQEGGAQVLVNALEVTPSGRWLNPTNHLLEKDFAVKLKAGTRMLDDNGETILTTSTDQQWLVYAQKDGAYGVELQGRIVWVDSAQVEETIARSDSGGPAATSLPGADVSLLLQRSRGSESRKRKFRRGGGIPRTAAGSAGSRLRRADDARSGNDDERLGGCAGEIGRDYDRRR